MGVKGLFQFLKRFQKEVYLPTYLKNKSVGIDIFWFIHQSKGDFFHFQNSILQILKYSQKVYCIFDGTPPPDKKEHLEKQAQIRQELFESINNIEKFLKYPFSRINGDDRRCIVEYLNQLKRQVWQPSPEFIQTVKNWLYTKNCIIYQATHEADDLLIDLEQKNIIDTIITNDSDLLIMGSSNIIRPKSPIKGAVFDKQSICDTLGFTAYQWNEFMYLCKNMKDNDVVLAYSLISVYKDLDYIIQKYYTIYNDELIPNKNIDHKIITN
jgi:5'-3' exonuclease